MALSIAITASRSCSRIGSSEAALRRLSSNTALKLFLGKSDLVAQVHRRGLRRVDAFARSKARRGKLGDGDRSGMHFRFHDRDFGTQFFCIDGKTVAAAD